MLLAVDIGNSRIKLGVFDHEKLLSKVSLPTDRDITPDALAYQLKDKLPQKTTASIVCSVVPEINEVVLRFASDRSGSDAVLVTNDLDFGLKIAHHPIEDAGADRLVNASAAVAKYGAPCIVCSFGTATTIDVVNAQRELIGGLIAPGLRTLAMALTGSTSRLPEVELVKPEGILQNTTVGALQSGIFNGYLALVDGLLTTVTRETSVATVIATGGAAAMVAENIDKINVVDADLTLDGLRLLYRRLKG